LRRFAAILALAAFLTAAGPSTADARRVTVLVVTGPQPPAVRAGATPSKHADRNIGEWNTFEITMRGNRLTVVLNGDKATGLLTVVVMPRPANKDEPALATPLSLTATPADFESGFAEVVAGYRKEHRSLAEQAEATAEVLRAARDASAKKGSTAKAGTKPVRPLAAATAAAAGGSDDERDEAGGDDGDTADTTPATSAAAPAPALATTTSDLFGD